MSLSLPQRLKSAWSLVVKGSIAPWDRLSGLDSGGNPERLSQPYANSVWVMRAIKKVAGPIGAVSLEFSRQMRRGDEHYEDPALELFWQKPAVRLSYCDFIEAITGWLKLEGEAFLIMDDTWLAASLGPRPSPLIVARPDRMKHVVKGGELIAWEFTDGASTRHVLLPEQVVQLKFWNPYDDWRGLAEYQAASIAAEADYLAGKFKRNLMANNGDQGVYVIGKSGIPTDEQRQQIVAQLKMKRELQQRGMFRPVFLTGDITIEDPKISAPDANFTAARLADRHEIFLALGVPPSMADKMESYSIGSASDWFMLITETCLPLAGKICEAVEIISRRLTGLDLYAWSNFDEHPVMQAVRRERFDSLEKLWTKGMPMQTINEYLDLGMPEFDGWEKGYLPFSVAVVGDPTLADPAEDPAASDAYAEPADETVQEMVRALRNRKDELHESQTKTPTPDSWQKARSAAEVARWREHMAQRRPITKAYESRFRRELMKARAEMLAKIEKFQSSGRAAVLTGLGQRAAAADFMFDLETFREGMLVSLRSVAASALLTAGKQLFAEIKRDDPWSMPPEQVLNFIRGRENKLSGAADDIFQRLKGSLEEGFTAGETMEHLADRVRAEFNGIGQERARTIAQTETNAAYGAGRQAAMESSGVKSKEWLTSGNDNVRAAHVAANGQVVPVDEPFIVGDEHLMHPGDPRGSAGNVINCHCVSIPVENPEP